MEDSTLLFASVSLNGNVYAVVEQDERMCYLYLNGKDKERLGVKSGWVRNLKPAPEQLDAAGMRAGQAPILPTGIALIRVVPRRSGRKRLRSSGQRKATRRR